MLLRKRLTLILALVLVVAGCGGDDEPRGSQAAAGEGFPVKIEHALGTTTIPPSPSASWSSATPTRSRCSRWASSPSARWTGSARAPSASGRGSATAWGGKPPAIVSSKSYEIDFEQVAAQRPDLILGLYAELKRRDYDKLSQIAPTVAQAKGDPYTTPWRDMTRTAAKAVGRVDEGERLIQETEARFAAFRKAHPEAAKETALVVDAGTAPKSYYPFSSKDPRGQFLDELGYQPSERDRQARRQDGFGAEIAKERVDLLDVDRLFLLIDAPARKRLDKDALFNRLDVARERRVTDLPYYTSNQIGAAVAFNSVLCIPYALDGIENSLGRSSLGPMRAVVYDGFGEAPRVEAVADPEPPPHGAVVRVKASGLCRSDWHGWMGHDPDIRAFPHVPGHELAGVVEAVGAGGAQLGAGRARDRPVRVRVRRLRAVRRRATSRSATASASRASRTGARSPSSSRSTGPTSTSSRCPRRSASTRPPGLGCRFATAYRAVVQVGRAQPGEWVAVHGCGGVGLSAVMIAAGLGARVVAVDVSDGRARRRAPRRARRSRRAPAPTCASSPAAART